MTSENVVSLALTTLPAIISGTGTNASMFPISPILRPDARKVVSCVAGLLLVLWALGSGYYIAFHDRILAGLISRQAEMQYVYEDRIAELRAALDMANAQTLHVGQAEETLLHDLATRGAKLEARADSLAALIGANRSDDLHLRATQDAGRHATLDAGEVVARFAALEKRQRAAVDALLERTEHASVRTQAALAELGLAPAPHAMAAVGGPFVPLAESTLTPEDAIALLKDALMRRRQIEAIAIRLPLRQPVEGPLDVTSGFGARRDPFYGRLALHTGIDLREGYGTTVRAVAVGVVTIAGPETGYGTLVEIDHGNGYATRYAHLSTLSVAVGQQVSAGATIGQVGTSGRSTGPHLHYEVRIAGEPVDPARYLKLATAIAGE